MDIKNKNITTVALHFVLTLTFLLFFSCKTPVYLTKIEGKKIQVDQTFTSNTAIQTYIDPYQKRLNKDLDSVISFTAETLDKTKGKWQSNIGDMFADACMEFGNPVFEKRENKKIDICVLNHGGIRGMISKGNITKRNAFEVMPFENTAVVLELKGDLIKEMAEAFIKDKKAHPLSGISINIDDKNNITEIKVQNNKLDLDKKYYVLTNDYLANGGDEMTFFLKRTNLYDLDYKLRNILIDYFLKHKTIKIEAKKRVN